jgi:signal transduction histidine kinase/ligand-binding sensor domain-containing protein
MKQCIFILWFSFFWLSSWAQISIIKQYVSYYSTTNGLPDNNINCIEQDEKGYIWIGTNQGLCYFDGSTFKQLKSINPDIATINSSEVVSLYSYEGKLLVSSSQKMVVLDCKTKRVDTTLKWLDNEFVSAFQPTGLFIWIATNKNLIKCDKNLNLIKKYPFTSSPSIDIHSIIKIYVLNNSELLLNLLNSDYIEFNSRTEKFSTVDYIPLKKKSNNPAIYSYYEEKNKILYSSVWSSGVFATDLITKATKRVILNTSENKPFDLQWFYSCNKINDDVYLNTGIGVFNFNTISQKVTRFDFYNFDNQAIYCQKYNFTFKDKAKNIWVATDNGLLKYNEKQNLVRNLTSLVNLKNMRYEISDFYLHNDSILYLSTYGNGLVKLDIQKNSEAIFLTSEMPFQWRVNKIKNKNVLRINGHIKYVMDFDMTTQKSMELKLVTRFIDSSNLFTFFYEDNHNRHWYSINLGGGILLHDLKKNTFTRFRRKDIPKTFSLGYANRTIEDDKGNMWFWTNKNSKFLEYHSELKQFIEYNSNDFKILNQRFGGINNILPHHDSLFICNDNGLTVLNTKTKTAEHFNSNNGLAGNNLRSIVADKKNRFWIGTNRGVSCLRKINDKIVIENFGTADGFSNIAMGLKAEYNSSKNLVTMASQFEVFQFNPDSLLAKNQQALSPIVETIEVNGNDYLLTDEALQVLHYSTNSFAITVGAIDFVSGSQLVFQVKLEGKDTNWTDLQQSRTIFYPNLKPNKYSILVRVKRNGGGWNYLNKPVTFQIIAPFWQRWWFIALSILLVFAGIILLIRNYFKREIKIEMQKLKQERAIEDERSRIAADMHDDLGSGLMQIKYMAEDMAESSGHAKVEDLKKLGVKANELTESMGEIIWSMRDRNNSLEDLFYYMRSQFLQYAEDNHLICQFEMADSLPDTIISGGARRHIYLICKECLHNIVKHAKATRVIFIVSAGKKLAIQIKDNGKGFNVKENYTGNGMVNLKKRAAIINGELQFTSNKFGTVVDLIVDMEKIQIRITTN